MRTAWRLEMRDVELPRATLGRRGQDQSQLAPGAGDRHTVRHRSVERDERDERRDVAGQAHSITRNPVKPQSPN